MLIIIKSGPICSIIIIYFVLLYIANVFSCPSIMLILGPHNITSNGWFHNSFSRFLIA